MVQRSHQSLNSQGRDRISLTFVVLEALCCGAAAPGVIRWLLASVVPRVDVSSEFNQHFHQVHVFHFCCVVKGRLVEFSSVHVCP